MKRVGWLEVGETGWKSAVYLLVIVCTVLGRAPGRAVVRLVALYYTILHATARRASRDWLERVHGRGRVSLAMVYRHLLRFSQVVLDRLFLVRRQTWRFEFRSHGEEHMRELRRAKTGAIFLSAHLGSFEAMRILADETAVAVNVIGYIGNAPMINSVLRRLDPASKTHLIDIEPGDIGFIFDLKERIDRGEHLAVLGDRVGLARDAVEVPFLGEPARFPSSVYRLAATLGCPVYLFFGIYTDPNRYDIYCEPFADRIVLPRGERAEAMRRYARRFAERLEHYGRLAPDNWFNFFDFWSDPGADPAGSKAARDQ